MVDNVLDYSLINKGDIQNKAFIMIHGWQGNKHSFKSIPNLLDIDSCAWYFPEAPYMFEGKPDKKTWAYEKSPGVWEVEETKRLLRSFIHDKVLACFDSKDVFVMGFSQGAAVCYELIQNFEVPLGGIFPIAGFIREFPGDKDKITLNACPKQYKTPILIGHGKDDDIVTSDASKIAYNALKKDCTDIDLYIYNGRHKIGIEYLKRVRALIKKKYQ